MQMRGDTRERVEVPGIYGRYCSFSCGQISRHPTLNYGPEPYYEGAALTMQYQADLTCTSIDEVLDSLVCE